MKSSCCGTEALVCGGNTKYYTCSVCNKPCDSIDDDILSKKEILEFCEKWGMDLELDECADNIRSVTTTTNNHWDSLQYIGDWLDDLQQFLKSVKHHMGKK